MTAALAEAPDHSPAFRARRVANWLPLGITYAALYMGRYNLNVIKGDLGKVFSLDKTQVGVIATAGFWTYAASVIVNGPLADRIGGRRAILVGAAGSALLNLVLGLAFFGGFPMPLILSMSLLYAACMYFQSFGALSIVKVNAAWFHVRERGVQGGIFGVMISSGYALALSLGGLIYGWSKHHFASKVMAFAPVFFAPALLLAIVFAVDAMLVRDSPKKAGYEDFHTGDATADESAEEAAKPVDFKYVVRVILGHPIIRVITVAEFCTGFVRQGLLLYFIEYLVKVHHQEQGTSFMTYAGLAPTFGGIAGALLCGWMSDKLFQSRRPPVAFIFYLGQIVSLVILGRATSPTFAAVMIGVSCMWIFGVHGMLSGTASADFGGKKAAASAAGLLDGIQYVGSGLTGFGLGALLDKYGWGVWTWALVPFSLAGAVLMAMIWNAKPNKGATGH